MNLVSFEWVVCQQYKRGFPLGGDPGATDTARVDENNPGSNAGVLILSEFARAPRPIPPDARTSGAQFSDAAPTVRSQRRRPEKGSVLINPHDTVATAEALHTALSMPAKEATALHSSAYAYVTENTAQSWAAKYYEFLDLTILGRHSAFPTYRYVARARSPTRTTPRTTRR